MSSNYDTWLEDRTQFCADYGRTTDDIMVDIKGEYILVEPDLMDDGDEVESGKMFKVYLPTFLQKNYIHDEKHD